MSVAGFFLLMGLAIGVRWVGNKFLPLVIPAGRRKTIALGWLGGWAGSMVNRLTWHSGPQVAEIYLVGAFIGSVLLVLAAGLAPFVKILTGKTS